MNTEGYVTSRQGAEVLNVRVKTLYRYMTLYPDFPQPLRISRALLFREAELTAWRERHETNLPDRQTTRPAQVSLF